MPDTGDIVWSAHEVVDELGPGFTEAVYHRALEAELAGAGIWFTSEATIPIFYKGSPVGRRRPDLFVETDDGPVVVELKATAASDSAEAQLTEYLYLLHENDNFDIASGLLISFTEPIEVRSKDPESMDL